MDGEPPLGRREQSGDDRILVPDREPGRRHGRAARSMNACSSASTTRSGRPFSAAMQGGAASAEFDPVISWSVTSHAAMYASRYARDRSPAARSWRAPRLRGLRRSSTRAETPPRVLLDEVELYLDREPRRTVAPERAELHAAARTDGGDGTLSFLEPPADSVREARRRGDVAHAA